MYYNLSTGKAYSTTQLFIRTNTEGRVSPLPGREKHRNVARYEVGRDHSIRLAFIVRATRSH